MTKVKKNNLNLNPSYERKESYLPHEVLDFLPNISDYPKGFNLKKIKKNYDGDLMKMGSDRYYVFRESLSCAFCDLTGSIIYKERGLDKNGNNLTCGYHFNLYAIDKDGNEVLMTKDHILAKSIGGKDIIDNYQTCCRICNTNKGQINNEVFKLLIKEKK